MISYRYVDDFNPPAPFVIITVRCPATGSQVPDLPAQVDSAADRTVLPGPLVTGLGLVEDGRLLFQGFEGEVVELPIFLVEVRVHNFPAVLVRAVLGAREPHILLGRDVLNVHRTLLDGPKLAVEVDRPSGGGEPPTT
jgi:hypothetical protein